MSIKGGTFAKGGEVLDWTYYDQVTLATAAAATTFNFFQNGLGIGGKTLAQTNLPAGGSIPRGQKLTVSKIKVFLQNVTALTAAALNDLYQVIGGTTVKIVLPGKDSMGTWLLAELMGTATLLAQAAPAVTIASLQQISPRYHGIFPLNRSLILEELTPLKLEVVCPAITAGINGSLLTIGLNGILERLS